MTDSEPGYRVSHKGRIMGKFSPVIRAAQVGALVLGVMAGPAHATFWSVLNFEGGLPVPAAYVTYASLNDMLTDTNRLGSFAPNPIASQHIVGGGSGGGVYWNLFNLEGEDKIPAAYVTYSSLIDMLTDTNRQGEFQPTGNLSERNLVDSGSDGNVYWNLFNIELETVFSAQYVTYSNVNDMLTDTNRLGVFTPNSGGGGRNLVGTGSGGGVYWSLFNFEGESVVPAQYVTYSSLNDMLTDTNRLGVFDPIGGGVGQHIVGSGSDEGRGGRVPEPATLALGGLAGALLLAVNQQAKRRRLSGKMSTASRTF